MTTITAIDAGSTYERASIELPRVDSALPALAVRRWWRRRHGCDCAAAIIVGALAAIGWALAAPADDRVSARRVSLERELMQLSPSLVEFARLARAGENTLAGVATAAARARPYMELRSLLETLSREAHAGVSVSRLRQTREGFELEVRAVDSAACAAWVARLARIPGWEGADIADLRLAVAGGDGQAGRAVEASVRLPSRAVASVPVSQRAAAGREARGGRSER